MPAVIQRGSNVWVQHGSPIEWRRGVVTELHGPVCKVSISVNDKGKVETHAKMTASLRMRVDDNRKPGD